MYRSSHIQAAINTNIIEVDSEHSDKSMTDRSNPNEFCTFNQDTPEPRIDLTQNRHKEKSKCGERLQIELKSDEVTPRFQNYAQTSRVSAR